MKEIIRALESLELSGLSLSRQLLYECTTQEARCACSNRMVGPASRIGVYLLFWENQKIAQFRGDCWSVRHKGKLWRTARSLGIERWDEAWVKGKPHAIIWDFKKSSQDVRNDVLKITRKYGLKIYQSYQDWLER